MTLEVDAQAAAGGKAALPQERRQAPYRETPDVASATARLIRSVGKRIATEDPDGLAALGLLQESLDEAWSAAVEGLRSSGYTDREIGAELGTTRQAVEQRWPRRRSSS
jgi:hypothetical protein